MSQHKLSDTNMRDESTEPIVPIRTIIDQWAEEQDQELQ